jgi:hypothetical protein
MSLTDAAVVIPGTGHIYLSPVGTPAPANADTVPAAPWTDTGHTSRDEGLTISRDGGDSEVKGTWQNANLRERRDPTTWALTFTMHQVDADVLRLFFGGGTVTEGKFSAPANPTGQEHALFVVMVDGNNRVGLYFPKVSILADDDISVDVEDFLAFPVRATVLSMSGTDLMAWLADTIHASGPPS